MNAKFSIIAEPGTDAWRKPPAVDVFNAPSHHASKPIPLNTFSSARVTFAGPWKERYDQGGLMLLLKHPDRGAKWVKTGVEFYNNRSYISTVGTDTYSDWGIYPTDAEPGEKITVETIRESDENGKSLWVYWLKLDDNGEVAEKLPLREICWFFGDEDGWSVEVSAYAARPAKGVTDSLEVEFWGLSLMTKQQVKLKE